MAWTYNDGSNKIIDYPRLLIADTDPLKPIFSDGEIMSAYDINSSSAFQSSQYFSGPGGRTLPLTPTNYLRCAAILLRALAASRSRLASVIQMLDVKLNAKLAADALQESAQAYLDMDDNSGAFFIAEQVTTVWGFYDRFWSQWQRQQGGVG
jgi:hypothetical protein